MSLGHSLGHHNEKTSLHSRHRPMYMYLYGSTGSREETAPLNTSMESGVATSDSTGLTPNSSSGAGDLDSLVGEALIATDTEDENTISTTPKNSVNDFQQMMMSPGGNRGDSLLYGRSGYQTKDNVRVGACGPAVCFASLLMIMATLSCALVLLLSPSRVSPYGSSATNTAPASELSFRMSFPRVDRSDYGDPVDQILDKTLFHSDLLYQGGADSARTFAFPFPTGAFWTNLVLPPTPDRGLSYPIFVYPYGFKWSETLFSVSYPYAHRKEEPTSIHDYFFPDLTFSCNETVSGRHITAFDPLSVSLRYETENKGRWAIFLVQGSPYVSMEFGSVTPSIRALSTFTNLDCPPKETVSYIETSGTRHQRRNLSYDVCETSTEGLLKTARGVQFTLTTQEGWTWIIFASEPLTLVFDTRVRTTVWASEPFNGAFRAAIIPSKSLSTHDLSMSSGLQRLINHAGTYPVTGEVSWVFSGSSAGSAMTKAVSRPSQSARRNRVATMSLKFTTKSFTPANSATTITPLLMLALPHQARRLAAGSKLTPEGFDLTYNTIKGNMTPVVGSALVYDEILLSPGFDNDGGSSSKKLFLDPVIKAALIENMDRDIDLALPTKTENVYGFGKQVARLAQLAHIASRLVESQISSNTSTDSGDEMADVLFKQAKKRLGTALEALLTGGITDALLYDANLGGLVTTDGLSNSGADFGNGRYNDHHFHYGYILYASAIMGRLDPTFVSKFKSQVDAVFYDVAHNGNFDSRRRRGEGVFFPAARHMNWFDGHSFASGLFPFGNGKSQESSSEAVNCYYGAYLWSLVRNGNGDNPESDTSLHTDFTRLLLSLEITGARTYWHMEPVTSENSNNKTLVYSDQFSKNFMVGNLGMNDAICSTWFGTQPLYVHMINFLPVTTATGELFGKEYATEEYDARFGSVRDIEMAWRGFVIADHAIFAPNLAWEEAQDVFSPTLDAGLSKTQLLYWISTRSGFEVPNSTEVPSSAGSSAGEVSEEDMSSSSSSDSCEQNGKCVVAGLTGKCCPTQSGVMLDCCS